MKGLSILALAAAAVAAGPAVAKELVYVSGLPEKHGVMRHAVSPLLDEIAKDSGGSITWQKLLGAQVVTIRTSLDGLSRGVGDAGHTIPLFNRKEMIHNNVLYDAPFFGTDPYAINGAQLETILLDCKECQEEYRRKNVVYLSEYASTSFDLICNKPVEKLADVKGLKIRASGGYGRWAEAMGGVAINMAPDKMVTAIDRGAMDCSVSPIAHMVSYGLKDVAKYVYHYPMGTGRGYVHFAMNRDSWNKLTIDQRKLILKHLPMSAARATGLGYIEADRRAVPIVKAEGVKIVDAGPEMDALMERFRTQEREYLIKSKTEQGATNAAGVFNAFMKNLAKWETLSKEQIKGDMAVFARLLKENVYDRLDVNKL